MRVLHQLQSKFRLAGFVALIAAFPSLNAQDAKKGKEIFDANCASCHGIQNRGAGPALKDVHNRRSEEWLLKWIKNNEALRKSGDAQAIQVFNDNGGAIMPAFGSLADADIKDIIGYIKEESAKAPKKAVVPPGGFDKKDETPDSTLYVLLALIGLFLLVFLLLARVKRDLDRLAAAGQGEAADEAPKGNFIQRLLPGPLARMNPVVLTMFALSIFGILGFVKFYEYGMTEVGVQKGYAPDQPINFSHKIHADEYAIDCKYCHSTADKSKSASIPALNTCMNCHKSVQARDKYDGEISPEIKKIYAALDYDPEKPANEAYGKNPKPVRWVRIHNLPDHAYFNHSQHVNVAGLTCQTCHGPVQKMEKVQQWSQLTMGWCINCHRETGIQVANNDYYEKLHEKVKADIAKNGDKSKYKDKNGRIVVTAGMNGGLECSKCHY
jgi:mono/diheme cytochrome c family protein